MDKIRFGYLPRFDRYFKQTDILRRPVVYPFLVADLRSVRLL
jgi:hypothetical protein